MCGLTNPALAGRLAAKAPVVAVVMENHHRDDQEDANARTNSRGLPSGGGRHRDPCRGLAYQPPPPGEGGGLVGRAAACVSRLAALRWLAVLACRTGEAPGSPSR